MTHQYPPVHPPHVLIWPTGTARDESALHWRKAIGQVVDTFRMEVSDQIGLTAGGPKGTERPPRWQRSETAYRLVHGLTQPHGARLVTTSPSRTERWDWDEIYEKGVPDPQDRDALARWLGQTLAQSELGINSSQPLEEFMVGLTEQWARQVWGGVTPEGALGPLLGRTTIGRMEITPMSDNDTGRASVWRPLQAFLTGWHLEQPQSAGAQGQPNSHEPSIKLRQPNGTTESFVGGLACCQAFVVQRPDLVPEPVTILLNAFLQDFWALGMLFATKDDRDIRKTLTAAGDRCWLGLVSEKSVSKEPGQSLELGASLPGRVRRL